MHNDFDIYNAYIGKNLLLDHRSVLHLKADNGIICPIMKITNDLELFADSKSHTLERFMDFFACIIHILRNNNNESR